MGFPEAYLMLKSTAGSINANRRLIKMAAVDNFLYRRSPAADVWVTKTDGSGRVFP